MRIPLTRCALVILSFLMLAGCQGGQSSWLMPDWSFLKWRPFSPSSQYAAASRPDLPSSQVSQAPLYPSAGYATASEPAEPPDNSSYSAYAADGYDASPNGYLGSQYTNPSANSVGSYGSSTGSAATPQDGLYSPNGYGATGRTSGALGAGSSSDLSRYSSSTGSGPYGSPSSTPYRSTDRDYNVAGATGPYGYATDTSPRYNVDSDRYGYSGTAADRSGNLQNGRTATADPYASVRDHNASRYSGTSRSLSSSYGDALGSGYGGALKSADSSRVDSSRVDPECTSCPTTPGTSSSYDTRLPYRVGPNSGYPSTTSDRSAAGPSSSLGGRYAQPETGSTGAVSGYNSYINGQPRDSQQTTDWNAGAPTPNMPGRTDYEPGNTGYPPGGSSYRSPASSYTPPYSGTGASAPFRPGSTGRLEPRNPPLSDTPEGAPPLDPTVRPTISSNNVIPAYYSR